MIYGYHWELVHEKSGDVVNDGFTRTDPPKEGQAKTHGFVMRVTPLMVATTPKANAKLLANETVKRPIVVEDDVAFFLEATRGMPAYKAVWAFNGLQAQVDFSGCSKRHMAEAWGKRMSDPSYSGLEHLTNTDLQAAVGRARNGERITPTQRTKNLLLEAKLRAASKGHAAERAGVRPFGSITPE